MLARAHQPTIRSTNCSSLSCPLDLLQRHTSEKKMSCTDAANDRNNALLHNDEVANAKVLDLSFGAYMN